MKYLTFGVWEYSRQNPKGFTLDIRTMLPIAAGICVAYLETQNSHGRESLETVIRHALAHEGFVGGWLNVTNGRYYFDSVRVFPETQIKEAMQFALEQKQLSIYILSKNQELSIN